jgi:hypothetical protein
MFVNCDREFNSRKICMGIFKAVILEKWPPAVFWTNTNKYIY